MNMSLILCMHTQVIFVKDFCVNFSFRTNVEIKFSKNSWNVINTEAGLTVGLQLGEVCTRACTDILRI
jgi:hypothetical protein